MSIPLSVALDLRRLQDGEIEVIPDVWRALFGTEVDANMPLDHVVTVITKKLESEGRPPTVNDLDDDTEVSPVTLTDEQLDAVQELRHIRSEMSDLRKRESDCRKEILQALGDAQRGFTASGEPCVKLRKSTRVGVDAKQLEALYPDVFDEVRTAKEVVTIDLP
jgi:hypothetical protein